MNVTALATDNQTYTPAEIDGIRAEIAALKDLSGLSWTELAREAGIPSGTLSPFATGSYSGDNQKIARNAKIWLMSRADKQEASRKLRRSPEFQKTPTASAFVETLMYAHTSPEIAVISGSPGTGKTFTAEHYAATNSNVYMTTMQPCTATVNTMLNALAEAMKLNERSQGKLSGAIGSKVRGAGALIIVDEASTWPPPRSSSCARFSTSTRSASF